MARAPKSRTTLLAEALAGARKVQEALYAVDLRTTRGDLREAVREARGAADDAVSNIGTALEHDVPAPRVAARA